MKKRNGNQSGDPVLTKLEEIKRLLMLGLLNNGLTQGDVARALGVDQATVSRMFPKPKRRRS